MSEFGCRARRNALGIAVLFTLAGLILLPAFADAKFATQAHVELGRSHGYRLTLEGQGPGIPHFFSDREERPGPRDAGLVSVMARKPGTFSEYTSLGSFSRRRIDGDLGRLGKVHLSFRERAKRS